MLNIDLKGKHAFVAGVADDIGFGFAIAKALYAAGAKVSVGTWPPMMRIFQQSWEMGKFDESRKLPDGRLFDIEAVFPMDGSYDLPEDVPQEVRENKRYADFSRYTISEAAEDFAAKFGKLDILVHGIGNAPEIKSDLLDTSRKGYLAALSSSSYSFIALLRYFGPHFNPGASAMSLTYLAGQRAVPGYGGGMSSAKAALENDMRMLAWEAGRRWHARVNCISPGPMATRAAKAIGIIDKMVEYSSNNAPLRQEVAGEDVAYMAAYLASPLARSITGSVIFVDNGLQAMGLAPVLTTHPL